MAYDPNPNNDRPDLRTPPEPRGNSSWMAWVAILAVIVVGAFAWSQMGGTGTDPNTTSSTTPAVTAPASPAPATPEAPATPPAATNGPTDNGANGGAQTKP